MKLPSELIALITEVRNLNKRIDLVLQIKEIEKPTLIQITEIMKMHSPGMKLKLDRLVVRLTDMTQEGGHSKDLDTLKDEAYAILERVTGNEL